MSEKYYGSSKEINNAKTKSISSKIKEYIAAALISGGLIATGSPAQAFESQYTPEELATYHRNTKEIENVFRSMTEAGIKYNKLRAIILNGKDDARVVEEFPELYEKLDSKTKKEVNKLNETTKEVNDLAIAEATSQMKIENSIDKHLIHMKTLPPQKGDTKTRIDLYVNDITSLSQKQIENLEKKYNINAIKMNRTFLELKSDESMSSYTPEIYKKLLSEFDNQFGDLKENKDLPDLEKVTIVLKRMENFKYDSQSFLTGLIDISILDDEAYKNRKMEGPLINKKGICTGYADLFKNVMSYLDIEAKEIRGVCVEPNKKSLTPIQNELVRSYSNAKGTNHAWNQVKLDGKWYNVDITRIVNANGKDDIEKLTPNVPHPYVLVSDSELNEERSSKEKPEYVPLIGLHEEAKESISNERIDKALETAINYENQRQANANIVGKKSMSKDKNFISYLTNNGELRKNTAQRVQTVNRDKNNSLQKDDEMTR